MVIKDAFGERGRKARREGGEDALIDGSEWMDK